MATDTTALTDAILAMHEAVAASEMANEHDPMALHFAYEHTTLPEYPDEGRADRLLLAIRRASL